MDRDGFLAAARAAAPELRQARLSGFPEPVWIRRMTVAEARRLAADAAAEGEDAAPNGDARVIATMVRNGDGELLFERDDQAQMTELQATIDAMDARVVTELLNAVNALAEPGPGEVDDAGN